ncbi:hypothetical protein ACGFZK_09050 [Streptomyces sp. NPDC048257]|uniref:hypothetical protein n=1 Tax=Streptomyces sp. NPDC048257 TaxID=3365526 RepID=UPI003712CD17
MARPEAEHGPQPAAPEAAASTAGYSSTELSPWAVAGGDLDAEFHIGLTVPRASFGWDDRGEHTHTRFWGDDPTTGSWAGVDYYGRTAAEFVVMQAGSRQLWDEITETCRWWEELGRLTDRYWPDGDISWHHDGGGPFRDHCDCHPVQEPPHAQ